MEECPVCKIESEKEPKVSASDKVNCPRCGKFCIPYGAPVEKITNDNYWLLSYWIRNNQKKDGFYVVKSDLINNIPEKISAPGPREQADNLIRWVGDISKNKPEEKINNRYRYVASIIGTKDKKGVKYILNHLLKEKFITVDDQVDTFFIRLTFEGWDRYEEIKRTGSLTRKVFMAMQYGDEKLKEFYEQHLKEAVKQTGFDLFILDDVLTAGLIDNQLRVQIKNARFLLADLTHDNHGAYWEAGYAEGLGKPVIYLCEKTKFDE